MHSYSATINSLNTNSPLVINSLFWSSSNRVMALPSFLGENKKKNLEENLKSSDDASFYSFNDNETIITNISRLTKSIVSINNFSKTDIYRFLDKKIKGLQYGRLSGLDFEISQQAVEDARYVLNGNITKNKLLAPKVMAIPSNEVNLNWDDEKVYLDMAIVGDGTYSFYLKDKLTGEEFCYDLKVWEKFPEFVMEKLNGSY